MSTTGNIDDKLPSQARRIVGTVGQTNLGHEGSGALIERESARRLARLDGTEGQLRPVPRRRSGRA